MQSKIGLKILIPVISVFFFLQGCNTTAPQQQASLNASGLLPFQKIGNWWKYTAVNLPAYGLTLSIIDTASDPADNYYKTSYQQTYVDTTVEWFRKTTSGTEYGGALLSGPYNLFLPSVLSSNTGTFSTGGTTVAYAQTASMTFGGKVFANVVQLKYSQPKYHGFNELDFVDSIGMVSLADTSGIVKVIYVLDSSFVGGKLNKY